MENRLKLAILGLVLVVSPMPAAMFFVSNRGYIYGLLDGTGGIRLDIQRGWLEIYSKVYRLIPLRLNFIEAGLLVASVAVFFVSLILIIRTYVKINEDQLRISKN